MGMADKAAAAQDMLAKGIPDRGSRLSALGSLLPEALMAAGDGAREAGSEAAAGEVELGGGANSSQRLA